MATKRYSLLTELTNWKQLKGNLIHQKEEMIPRLNKALDETIDMLKEGDGQYEEYIVNVEHSVSRIKEEYESITVRMDDRLAKIDMFIKDLDEELSKVK